MKFINILLQLNIPYKTEGHHHCRPGWVQIDCPFCGKDSHKWHLGYSLEEHYLNCWRCGSHPLIGTLMELTGYSYIMCKRILKDVEKPTRIKKERPKGKLVIPKGVMEMTGVHRRYLRERGFNPSEIEKLWKVQGIYIASRLSWRLFIPIFYHGKIVSWTTRSISNRGKVTRYISAGIKEESMFHKFLLYGEDFVQQSIIITEGPLDAWKIGPGAAATLGIGYTLEQLIRIARYSKRAICFDNSNPAQKRAQNLCNDLSVFPGKTYNVTLDSKDPGEATAKEIEKLREFLK